MLGFNAIQRVGHHLEDGFKLLKDHPVKVDRRLEDLFLQGFDILKEFVHSLQSPYGLREQETEKVLQAAAPLFIELQTYLHYLIHSGHKAAACQVIQTTAESAKQVDPKLPALLNRALKKMLELFKQGDTPVSRQQLKVLCARMVQLQNSREWQSILQTAQAAIDNSKNTYQTLAPVVIKELKQAGDLLITGRASEITPSRNLQQLASVLPAPEIQVADSNSMTAASLQQNGKREFVTAKSQQVTIPAEPRAVAKVLLETFNREQLIELAEFLMKALQ